MCQDISYLYVIVDLQNLVFDYVVKGEGGKNILGVNSAYCFWDFKLEIVYGTTRLIAFSIASH